MTTISGKTTLITGAAHGMGRKMASQFARRGAALVLVDIDEAGLQETIAGLPTTSRLAHSFVCDLARREEIQRLKSAVHEQVGQVDILINNAAVVTAGPFNEIDDERDQLMLDVNISAVHWMTKAFLPDLKAGTDTHLVQLASAAGLVGVPDQVVYCASKWFVIGQAEALRQELRARGHDHVGVSIICPSFVDTGMFAGARPPLLSPFLDPDFVVDRIVKAVEDDELFVMEPFIVRFMPLLKALLPTPVADALMAALGATRSMAGWQGHGR